MFTTIKLRKASGGPSYPHFVRIEFSPNFSTEIFWVKKEGKVSIYHEYEGMSLVMVDGVVKGEFKLPGEHVIVIDDAHYLSAEIFHEGC